MTGNASVTLPGAAIQSLNIFIGRCTSRGRTDDGSTWVPWMTMHFTRIS